MVIVSYQRLLVMNLTSTQRRSVIGMALLSRAFSSYSEGAPVCALRLGRATELAHRGAARTSVSSESP